MKYTRQKNSRVVSISRQDALQCVPTINNSVVITELDTGDIMLEYPLPMKPFFMAIYKRFQKNTGYPTKKLQLDEMGTLVWKGINGVDSVQTIISSFAEHYGITLQESEKSVTAFLVELGKRGLIAMR